MLLKQSRIVVKVIGIPLSQRLRQPNSSLPKWKNDQSAIKSNYGDTA